MLNPCAATAKRTAPHLTDVSRYDGFLEASLGEGFPQETKQSPG